MKFSHLIIGLLLLVSLLFGCNKDEIEQKTLIYPPLDLGFGFAQALKNNLNFEGGGWVNVRTCDDGSKYLSIALYTENGQGFEREEFNLVKAPLADFPKFYELPANVCGSYIGGTSYHILDYEHLEDLYVVDSNASNWISIDVADTVNNVLKGRFQVRFVIDPLTEKMNPENPDVVEFTNGVFDLKFKN